jgi:hypothetical protein
MGIYHRRAIVASETTNRRGDQMEPRSGHFRDQEGKPGKEEKKSRRRAFIRIFYKFELEIVIHVKYRRK